MLQAVFSVWNGRIAPVFDTARVLVPVRFSEGVFTEGERVTLPEPSAACALDFFREEDIRCLICGAISRSLQSTLEADGIEVFGFVAGDLPEVLRAWVEGRLDEPGLRMPGCGCGKRRRGGRNPACCNGSAVAPITKMNCHRWGGRNQAN